MLLVTVKSGSKATPGGNSVQSAPLQLIYLARNRKEAPRKRLRLLYLTYTWCGSSCDGFVHTEWFQPFRDPLPPLQRSNRCKSGPDSTTRFTAHFPVRSLRGISGQSSEKSISFSIFWIMRIIRLFEHESFVRNVSLNDRRLPTNLWNQDQIKNQRVWRPSFQCLCTSEGKKESWGQTLWSA